MPRQKLNRAAWWLVLSWEGGSVAAAAGPRLWSPRSPAPPTTATTTTTTTTLLTLPSPNHQLFLLLRSSQFTGSQDRRWLQLQQSLPSAEHTCAWQDRRWKHLAGRRLPGECLTQGWHRHRHTGHGTLAARHTERNTNQAHYQTRRNIKTLPAHKQFSPCAIAKSDPSDAKSIEHSRAIFSPSCANSWPILCIFALFCANFSLAEGALVLIPMWICQILDLKVRAQKCIAANGG